jgi:hypothetical protein
MRLTIPPNGNLLSGTLLIRIVLALISLMVFAAPSAEARPKRRGALPVVAKVDRDPDEDERLGSGDTEPIPFDSGLSFGLGSWLTPALPRLKVSSENNPLGAYSIDTANYRPEASAVALVLDTRLFFPFLGIGLPLGLSVLTQSVLTEVPSLPFTSAGTKAPVRPKHSLGLDLGLRADFGLGALRSESSIELGVQHIVYLSANLTTLSPQVRQRVSTHHLFDLWRALGARPVMAFEVHGSPYATVTGFDNRIGTESSGEVRSIPGLVQFAKSSTGWGFGVQMEMGILWPRTQRGREESLAFVWGYQSRTFSKVLESKGPSVEADSEVEGQLTPTQSGARDSRSVLNSFGVLFRSSFL